MQPPTRDCSTIIHAAAAASAGVGAGFAQVPGADAPVLTGIQAAMVISIADTYGVSLTQAMATQFVLGFVATVAGRGVSQWLVGWILGWGNTINASTAAALTEAVGWAARRHFERIS